MPKTAIRAGKLQSNATTSGFVTLNAEDKIAYISAELNRGLTSIDSYLGKTVWDVFPLLLFNGFYEEVERIRNTGCQQFNSLWLPELNIQVDYLISPAIAGGLIIKLIVPLVN